MSEKPEVIAVILPEGRAALTLALVQIPAVFQAALTAVLANRKGGRGGPAALAP